MKLLRVLFKIVFVLIILVVVTYFVGYLSTRGDYNIAKTVDEDTTLPHLRINNTLLHLETFGNPDSQKVVILHGGPGFDYKYLYPLKALANNFYVIFYDQRGTGLSERVSLEDQNLETTITDLDQIIDHFSLNQKVHIVGHSWGGMLGCEYFRRFPGKVDKLVMAEPGMLTSETAELFMQKTNYMRPQFSWKMLVYFMKSYFQSNHIDEPDGQAAKDYLFEKLMLAPVKGHPLEGYFCNNDPGSVEIDYWRLGAYSNQGIMMSGMTDEGTFDINFVEGVKEYPNPVLLLASECNKIIGMDHQKIHANYFNNITLKMVPNSGHYMFSENETSISMVKEFLLN